MAINDNRDIRREAFNIFSEVLKERLEEGNVTFFELKTLAEKSIEAIMIFKEVSEALLGPTAEDCYTGD